MGCLIDAKEIARKIEPVTMYELVCEMDTTGKANDFLKEVKHDANKEEQKFITSPADIDTYREIKLKDADVKEKD